MGEPIELNPSFMLLWLKLKDHIYYNSSQEEHECMHQILWKSIQ